MLKLFKFEVSNYRGINKKFVFNLSSRDYTFNNYLVKEDLVNQALLVGSSNKTNFLLAVYDIVTNISTRTIPMNYYYGFSSINNKDAEFTYYFKNGEDTIIYRYTKICVDHILKEEIYLNDELILARENREKSILIKHDKNNKYHYIIKLIREYIDGIVFIDFNDDFKRLIDVIVENKLVKEFEKFLKKFNFNYSFKVEDKDLFVLDKDNEINFKVIMTKFLGILLKTFLLTKNSNLSIILIDNFDSIYYQNLERLFKILGEEVIPLKIIASNSTHLISNEFARPDCIYLIDEKEIRNLYECSNKEIRYAHNLEKMYLNKLFDN